MVRNTESKAPIGRSLGCARDKLAFPGTAKPPARCPSRLRAGWRYGSGELHWRSERGPSTAFHARKHRAKGKNARNFAQDDGATRAPGRFQGSQRAAMAKAIVSILTLFAGLKARASTARNNRRTLAGHNKWNVKSRRRVRHRFATRTVRELSTNAVIVARPTPAAPPLTRNP